MMALKDAFLFLPIAHSLRMPPCWQQQHITLVDRSMYNSATKIRGIVKKTITSEG